MAQQLIDATGDGDIFSKTGEPYDTDIFENSMHHQLNVGFLWAGVDMERFFAFRKADTSFQALEEKARKEFEDISSIFFSKNVLNMPHVMPRNDVCLFMSPKLNGYDCLNIEDLTKVEILSRRIMMRMLAFFRKNVPGFENAWVMLTAPQIGVRHSRRLDGIKKMSHNDWKTGILHEDEIGVTPPPNTKTANISIPLGCLIPKNIDNLIVAGRNLSCDSITHDFMRLIPQCWQTGQAAGVAAAVACSSDARIRDVDIAEVRKKLKTQGVHLR